MHKLMHKYPKKYLQLFLVCHFFHTVKITLLTVILRANLQLKAMSCVLMEKSN